MSTDVITAVVVDDEPLGRDRIRLFASQRTDLIVVAECSDGPSAVKTIQATNPDLVFLDVQMPGLDGIGVVREIGPDLMPSVIFVTAYDEHAVHAFEVHALDYLLKPFRAERFSEAVDRAVRIIREGRSGAEQRLDGFLAASQKHIDRILVKSAKRAFFVRADQIDWIEAAGNYLRLHVGEKVHLIRQTMNKLECQLDPDRFVRIHRSAIVNLENVKELQRTQSGEFDVVLTNGQRLKLSRGYRRGIDRFDPFRAGFAR